jgi:hypothetical protein
MVCRYKAQLGPVAVDLLKGGTVPFREFGASVAVSLRDVKPVPPLHLANRFEWKAATLML